MNDAAVLSGGSAPTGTITFRLFRNGGGTPVDTEMVPVTGNGTYTTPVGYPVPKTPAGPGTYQWDTSYSGDAGNQSATDDNNPNQQVVVSAGSPTASITTPASGAIYAAGEDVTSSFACTEGVGGPGISTCVNQGNQPSGQQVDASTVGTHMFTVTVTSGDGRTGTATVSYAVAGGPSASIASPGNGASYAFGKTVPAEFTCSEGTAGPGILSCAGTTASGSDVDTSTPGTHTLRVTATSTDGQSTTRTVTYTVRPDNREALGSRRSPAARSS